jgi:DNA-binding PadR family transcriptional regulator
LHAGILTVLAREELHGYRVAEEVAKLPPQQGEKPDVSGVYRCLKAMERGGFAIASWGTSSRGPGKRRYRITRSGRACLTRWLESLERYREAIGDLLVVARQVAKRAARKRRALAPR